MLMLNIERDKEMFGREKKNLNLPSLKLNTVEDCKVYFKKFHSVLKNDQFRTRIASLFHEENNLHKQWEPIFCLKEEDTPCFNKITRQHEMLPSFKRIYLLYNHVPYYEYEFAKDIFNSWDHWQMICDSSSLSKYVKEMREELAIKLKTEAIKELISVSKEKSTIGISAARYLADEGYLPKRAGRTTKEEKTRQQKIAAGVRDDLASDMARLGISVVKG